MEVFPGIKSYAPPPAGVTLTIGNFDGMHRGHQRIIEKARQVGRELATPVVAMTFEPHPLAVVTPEGTPPRLVTLEEKLHLLRRSGVDACIVMRSEPALLNRSAEAFLHSAVKACRPRAVVEGPDFNFGRGRQGSVQTLHQFAERLGFMVYVIETARCDELPGAPSVHSAAIRAALREGRVDLARAMLGRPHRVTGTVGKGAGRGGGFGLPTANLYDIPHLLPQQAVYAAVAQFEDGQLHLAAVNVGPQPTFGQTALRVEAHVLDWTTPLRGRTLGLHFILRLRQQRRFGGVEELAARIRRDVSATRQQGAALRELERRPPIPLGQ